MIGFIVHRNEQWDLGCVPLVCVHRERRKSCARVFCLWGRGVQIGRWYWMRKVKGGES